MAITRRDFLKVSGFGLIAISCGGASSACSGDSSGDGSEGFTGSGEDGETSEVVIAMDPESEPRNGFNPLFSWGCGLHEHDPLIQSTLVATDVDLNFVNDLATGYSTSDDGLTWTFDLRSDATFSEGTPVTAEDVVFTLEGVKTAKRSKLDLSYIESVEATSDTQVLIHLNKPFNALLYVLANIGIVPASLYDKASYGEKPIGSGRYMLEKWDEGKQVVLTANPAYYGDAPKMQRVVVKFMDEEAALAAVQAGEVDVAYVAAAQAGQVPSGYNLFSCSSVDARGISLPVGEPGGKKYSGGRKYPTGNSVTTHKEVRQAINYVLDRQLLVDDVLMGYGSMAYSVCDNLSWASNDMQVATDLNSAAKTMENAGWVKGEDGVYALGDERAAFDLYYPVEDSTREQLALTFADQMGDFGIEVNPIAAEWTNGKDGIFRHQYSDPVLWSWGANSPVQLYDLVYSESDRNYSGLSSVEVDSYADAALAEASVSDSYDDWKNVQWDGTNGIAPAGEASWVWLVTVDHLYFVRKGLKIASQKPHAAGRSWPLLENVDQWSWKSQ